MKRICRTENCTRLTIEDGARCEECTKLLWRTGQAPAPLPRWLQRASETNSLLRDETNAA